MNLFVYLFSLFMGLFSVPPEHVDSEPKDKVPQEVKLGHSDRRRMLGKRTTLLEENGMRFCSESAKVPVSASNGNATLFPSDSSANPNGYTYYDAFYKIGLLSPQMCVGKRCLELPNGEWVSVNVSGDDLYLHKYSARGRAYISSHKINAAGDTPYEPSLGLLDNNILGIIWRSEEQGVNRFFFKKHYMDMTEHTAQRELTMFDNAKYPMFLTMDSFLLFGFVTGTGVTQVVVSNDFPFSPGLGYFVKPTSDSRQELVGMLRVGDDYFAVLLKCPYSLSDERGIRRRAIRRVRKCVFEVSTVWREGGSHIYSGCVSSRIICTVLNFSPLWIILQALLH